MVTFNIIILVCSLILFLNIVRCSSLKNRAAPSRNRCPPIYVDNGRLRIRQSGLVVRITCNPRFKLVQGNEIANCVRGEWDTETPICAQTGCPIMEKIPHGVLNIVYNGAKLEVTCDLGYSIIGPSFIYCNENFQWNEELKGCKESDQIYMSCDFESSDERFCGWKNDIFNDIDWLADKSSFLSFGSRRHVPSGSSQYFSGSYISLDAGNYGSSTSGRLISPPILPFKIKQRCLMFSYKVMAGSYGPNILKVSFGGIPHWATSKGEGKVIIGLYKFNVTSKIVIEGKSCRAAIDNLIIADGDVCGQQPYEEESDSCHDNCGKITNDMSCSCDWECHHSNDCCLDLKTYCPYIRPSEEIDRLYKTTAITTTSTKKTNTIQMNVTMMPHSTYSLKINESKVPNDLIIETTPMNEHNVTMNNTTTSIFTQSSPMSNITHSPLPTTTPTTLISPINITVQISSTLTPYEVLKFNNTSTNYSLATNSSSTSLMFKHITIVPNKTSIVNISTITAKMVDNPVETTKFVLNNTNIISKQIAINASSSTAKPDVTNTTVHSTKSTNTSETTVEYFIITNKTNVLTPILFNTTSTVQPRTISTIPFTKIKSVNFSSTTQKPSMKSNNASTNFEPLNTIFSIKSTNVQNITQNDLTTQNKSTTLDNMQSRVELFNNSSVFKHKMVVVDTFQPSSNLTPTNYGTTLKDENTLFNQNNLSRENIESTNHSELYKSVEKNKPTKDEISNEKPELYNFLHSKTTTGNGSKSTIEPEYKKQNDHSKSPGLFVYTFKYVAAIGVVLITLKFTLSLVRWYFKKPTNDEMNACFIEPERESVCNIELVSNN